MKEKKKTKINNKISSFFTLVIVLAFLISSIAPQNALAAIRKDSKGSLQNTINYLNSVQNKDGGFPSKPGEQSSPAITAWVIMSLSAGGEDLHQKKWAPSGHSPKYYLDNSMLEFSSLNDYSRYTLAYTAMGEKPVRNGIDLVAKILSAQQKNGELGFSDECQDQMINSHMWAVLALSSAGKKPKDVTKAKKWLISAQNKDGGFGWYVGGESDPDDTGVAIQTLIALGENPKKSSSIKRAVSYLQSHQNKDGGFGSPESNSASDAWVLQGLMLTNANKTALRQHLWSLQQKNGSFFWRKDSDSAIVMMTAYSLCALSGHSYPVRTLKKGK